MIHFVVGKPGGGKSYFAVRQLCHELLHGERFIVTNLALNMEELADFCHKEGTEPVDIAGRVRILNDLESKKFWIYEGPGRACENRIQLSDGNLKIDFPDFSDRTGKGVLYIIDEVHVHFNARNWQATSSDCTHYQTQHRKLGDDVLLVTQHPEQVDKAFRRLAQDYTVIRYLANERILGFNVGRVFRRATYLDVKTKGDHQPAQETGYFRMEVKRYGKLYNTHAGVGIVGRTDVKERHGTGRSLWWLVAIVLGVGGLIWFAPQAAVGSVKWGINKMLGSKKEIVQKGFGTNVTGSLITNDVPASPPLPPAEHKNASAVNLETNRVYVTGLVPAFPNAGYRVMLSDGRRYSTFGGEVQYIAKDHVIIGTNRYEFRY